MVKKIEELSLKELDNLIEWTEKQQQIALDDALRLTGRVRELYKLRAKKEEEK